MHPPVAGRGRPGGLGAAAQPGGAGHDDGAWAGSARAARRPLRRPGECRTACAGRCGRWRRQVIVNAGAYTRSNRPSMSPDAARAVNGDGPAVLAAEAERLGAWLLHYSHRLRVRRHGRALDRDRSDGAAQCLRPKQAGGRTGRAGRQRASGAAAHELGAPRGGNFIRNILRTAATQAAFDVVQDQQWAFHLGRDGGVTRRTRCAPPSRSRVWVCTTARRRAAPTGMPYAQLRGRLRPRARLATEPREHHPASDGRPAAGAPASSTHAWTAAGFSRRSAWCLPDWQTQVRHAIGAMTDAGSQPMKNNIPQTRPSPEASSCRAGSGLRLYPRRWWSASTAAGLRQADDLLPAQHAAAGRHPRHPDHLPRPWTRRGSEQLLGDGISGACG